MVLVSCTRVLVRWSSTYLVLVPLLVRFLLLLLLLLPHAVIIARLVGEQLGVCSLLADFAVSNDSDGWRSVQEDVEWRWR